MQDLKLHPVMLASQALSNAIGCAVVAETSGDFEDHAQGREQLKRAREWFGRANWFIKTLGKVPADLAFKVTVAADTIKVAESKVRG